MLFHKPTQTAFVLPTRTGSTSTCNYLVALGFKYVPYLNTAEPRMHHMFPAEAFEVFPNLKNYKLYGFFRNPLDRYLSICRMFNRFGQKVTPDHITKNSISDNIQLAYILKAKQIEWLNVPNMTVLDFDNFSSELKAFGSNYNDSNYEVMHINAGRGVAEATPEIIEFVRNYYAADYAFAKDALGKEY